MPQKEFVGLDFGECLATLRQQADPATFNSVGPDAFNTAPTPEELNEIYNRGFQGINKDTITPEQDKAYTTMMAAMPRLYDIFPWAKGLGKGKVNAPFLAALKLSPTWGGDEAQTVGSCTVHGAANACEPDHANDSLFGETQYKGRIVKENIYRHRGYNSHGWSCRAPCTYVGPDGKGGLLFRQVYTNGSETVDLSKLNESWASNGRGGVPAWLEEISRKSKVKWVIPIANMEEYRDACALGFGINVCSGQGFSSTTDEFCLAAASGSWSHAMAHTACIDTPWAHSKYGDMIGGINQSWGRWNRQNGKPEGLAAVPVGYFFGKANVIARMVSGGDSFAMCSVWGWERTGWEAFDVTGMVDHLRGSTAQDYYKTRSEKAAEYVVEALESGAFNTAL